MAVKVLSNIGARITIDHLILGRPGFGQIWVDQSIAFGRGDKDSARDWSHRSWVPTGRDKTPQLLPVDIDDCYGIEVAHGDKQRLAV